MNLTVVDPTGNRTEQVSLPERADSGRVVGRLVEVMQLPVVGPGGESLSYRFHHIRSGRQISDNETLAQAGVEEHDVLRLVVAPAAHAAPPAGPANPAGTAIPAGSAASAGDPSPAGRAASAGGAVPAGAAIPAGATAASQLPPTQTHPAPPPPPRAPRVRMPVQPASPIQPAPRRRGANPTVLAIAVIAILGIGAVAALATGALSSGAHASARQPTRTTTTPAPTTSVPTQTAPTGPSPTEEHGDRTAIMALLGAYTNAYSAHSLGGLATIFSPGITRHGLAAGGCTVARGRGAVLDDYRSQFEEGSGSYRLVGLSESQIGIDSSSRAHINAHYRIEPGGSGYVNFRFANLGDGWKISEVYATCE